MPPVVSFVGTGKVGKTTFLEKLIPELVRRGYRVATIKHTVHPTTLDQPDKDTARHLKAGSSVVVISSPNEVALIKRASPDVTLGDLVRQVGEDYDILITEGFKQGNAPKIEVHRREKGEALGESLTGLIAVITDELLDLKVKQFSLENVRGVADLIENDFIKPNRERLVLYVNGKPVAVNASRDETLKKTILRTVSSIKDVSEIRSVDISIRRKA